MEKCPYSTGCFGAIPNMYLRRDGLIDEIETRFEQGFDAHCFKLTGLRGSGKSVTFTDIRKVFSDKKDWIVINVNANAQNDVYMDVLTKLYDKETFLSNYIDMELNLSLINPSFSLHLKNKDEKPITNKESALSKILDKCKEKNKKVLICIDELRKTDSSVEFISSFQNLVSDDKPIYIISTSLPKDLIKLETTDGLTFFARAPKKETVPLNISLIKMDYRKTLKLEEQDAQELARQTEGYAYAYQAFGKAMWNTGSRKLNEEVIELVDIDLAEEVYRMVWNDLTNVEREYVTWLSKHSLESVEVSKLLQELHKKNNEWSMVRRSLAEKYLISTDEWGKVRFKLPRFDKYIENQIL